MEMLLRNRGINNSDEDEDDEVDLFNVRRDSTKDKLDETVLKTQVPT